MHTSDHWCCPIVSTGGDLAEFLSSGAAHGALKPLPCPRGHGVHQVSLWGEPQFTAVSQPLHSGDDWPEATVAETKVARRKW
jgi:hypothetical protein